MIGLYIFIRISEGKRVKPDFYNYTEDKFKRWKWTWEWIYDNGRNRWMISEMKAHCPNCDTPMIDYSNIYGNNFRCPHCEYSAGRGECDEPVNIERIILDNINRGIIK